MPVAFNPPPFPTVEPARAAAAEGASDGGSVPADAFAQLLQAAGSIPGALSRKEADATATRQWLLHASDRHGSGKSAPITLPPNATQLPVETPVRAAAGATSPASNAGSLDPATMTVAMMAALNAAIAPVVEADAPSRAGIAGGVSEVPGGRPVASLRGGAVGMDPEETTTPGTVPADTGLASNSPHASLLGSVERAGREALLAASDARASTIAARASQDPTASESAKEIAHEASIKPGETRDMSESSASMLASANALLARPALPTAVQSIDTPVAAPGWDSELAGKLTQVVMLGHDRAEFHLHPAELGPIDVRITFASDQAVVLITAAHAATRDALEQALPYLRDMLAGQGIALGQANVQGERNPADSWAAGRDQALHSDSAQQDAPELTVRAVALRGLVDVFA